jgi:steroid delta-isomerase-like uncharacterized protein
MTASADLRSARLALIEEHLDAENRHDLDALMATFGHQPGFGLNDLALEGHAAVRGLYDSFGFGDNGGFSDLACSVVRRHVGDESVTLELILRGTHTAEWQGIPPTGKSFEVPACAIFDFDAENRIAAERVYLDMGLLMRQLGVGA